MENQHRYVTLSVFTLFITNILLSYSVVIHRQGMSAESGGVPHTDDDDDDDDGVAFIFVFISVNF